MPAKTAEVPPRVMTIGSGYEKIMEAFGGRGWFVEDPKDLRAALDEAMAYPGTGAGEREAASRRRPQAAAVRLAYVLATGSPA